MAVEVAVVVCAIQRDQVSDGVDGGWTLMEEIQVFYIVALSLPRRWRRSRCYAFTEFELEAQVRPGGIRSQ